MLQKFNNVIFWLPHICFKNKERKRQVQEQTQGKWRAFAVCRWGRIQTDNLCDPWGQTAQLRIMMMQGESGDDGNNNNGNDDNSSYCSSFNFLTVSVCLDLLHVDFHTWSFWKCVKYILLIPLFYSWCNRCTEMLSNLHKVTQLKEAKAGYAPL